MREILFRGKDFNNKWIEGLPVKISKELSLIRKLGGDGIGYYDCGVFDSTIGQFTGLTDKNGKKIFEGDILKTIHYFRGSMDEFKKKKIRKAYGKAIENKNSYLEEFTYFRNYVVEYSAKKCAWIGRNGSDQHELKSLTNCFHKGAVIGNIHDNPELLEVKK